MREMKDSGIEWIGEIPVNWAKTRIGNLFRFSSGDSLTNEEIQDEGLYKVYGANGPRGYYHHTNLAGKHILIGRVGALCGNIHIVDEPVWVTEHALIAEQISPDVCTDFAGRVFESMNLGQYSKASAQPVIASSVVQRLQIPIPPSLEQRRIADYLDRKCSQIDAIIARQQEVIEKLKDYKLSVITEVVTKGLNPDVPMKDSGVEWIGEVPEHWKMVRLKFLLSQIIDCPHETPIYSDDGAYLVIRTADQDLGKLRTDEDMYRLDESEYQNRIRRMSLEKDDIVYGREGERWGLACLVPESNKYCLGQRMLQFRCKIESFLPRFAMWALNSKFVYLQGAVDTIGSTSPHVNISTLRNFLIPVPNINEQQEIAEYIDKKMLQLDKEVKQRENLINKLNEYKKSLIYEVVTGKKEV